MVLLHNVRAGIEYSMNVMVWKWTNARCQDGKCDRFRSCQTERSDRSFVREMFSEDADLRGCHHDA
jgi:hypothetical protein